MKYSKEEYLKMYELLTFARKYELKVPELLSTGKLPGFYHLAVGQEAIQMALYLELEDGDWAAPHPRCHPFYALKCGIKEFTREMIGKPGGVNGGVASYVHLFDPENRICPSNGILGQTQAIASGFAMGLKLDKSDAIVAIGLGDGTMEEGIVSETLNMIAAYDLKVCVILENNNISISTPKDSVSRLNSPGDRAAGFGLPVVYGNGNDILEARELIRVGLEEARKGRPNVVELKTYRLRGHFEGDPATYRDQKEVDEAMKREPVGNYARYLLENDIATQAELDAIDKVQQEICDEAFADAFAAPDNTPSDVINPSFVYAD